MEAKKVMSPEAIKAAIVETAAVLKRKQELHENVQAIESELKTLNESIGMLGGFGFVGDQSSKTTTGFVNTPSISHIAQLEAEFKDAPVIVNEDQLNEVTKLKEEIEKLQKENAELKTNQVTK